MPTMKSGHNGRYLILEARSKVIVRPEIHFSIDQGLFGVRVMIKVGQTALSKTARFQLRQSWH